MQQCRRCGHDYPVVTAAPNVRSCKQVWLKDILSYSSCHRKARALHCQPEKRWRGISLRPGDPFVSAAVVHAAVEVESVLDGVGGDGRRLKAKNEE